VELRFLARELPACGYRVYELVGEEGKQESDLVVGPSSLENEALRVGVGDDGTVTVLHKETGAVFPGCLVFESTEDAGDEYNYSPAAQSETVTSEGAKAEIALVERGPVSATFRLGLELQLPEGLREDRLARSERRVACPITSYVTLHAGLPRVDFRTGVENRARDHRLRVLFPTAIEAEASHAETQFGVVSRPVDLPEWKGWAERPVPTHPQRSFVDVHDGKAGLCLINRGLPEYEARRGPQGTTLALTLLRCVGWLSRGDGAWRPYPVGPQVPTPEGQCLGSWEFHYSLFPHAGSWQEAQVWRQAHQFAAPPRALLTEGHAGALPGELSFFALSPAQLVLSALKKIESREALLVRLYNTTEAEIQGRLACYRRVRSARRVTLGEEALEGGAVAVSGKEIRFPVGRYEIVSLEIELA
jgi:alpha-mannosidase